MSKPTDNRIADALEAIEDHLEQIAETLSFTLGHLAERGGR